MHLNLCSRQLKQTTFSGLKVIWQDKGQMARALWQIEASLRFSFPNNHNCCFEKIFFSKQYNVGNLILTDNLTQLTLNLYSDGFSYTLIQ